MPGQTERESALCNGSIDMATIVPSSIRPHRAERAMARGFGGQIPSFFAVPASGDWLNTRKRTHAQPPKLLPSARRYVEKLGRKARLAMLQTR